MFNTNVGDFKDWPLEQSHFDRIPSILFLLHTVCFRVAALGTVLRKKLNEGNGCIAVLPYQPQQAGFFFLNYRVEFVCGSQAFEVISM